MASDADLARWRARLLELVAAPDLVERMAVDRLFERKAAKDADSEEQRAKIKRWFDAMEGYFAQFAVPLAENRCLVCNGLLIGLAISGEGYEWDTEWGAIKCRQCGYPGRGHHIIRDPDNPEGEPIGQVFNVVLMYHPSMVEPTEETEGRKS